MNSDFSNLPPEERELSLTALLLGELPPAEADQLRAALAADPEVAREHERLSQTIELVRETRAMERQTSAAGTPLRLDDTRRQKLLEVFKQPLAAPVAAPRRPRDLRFLPLALAAALVGLLIATVMLPSLAKSKAPAQRTTVLMSLKPVSESLPQKLVRLITPAPSPRPDLDTQREVELALTENFSTSAFDAEGTKAAPAPKLPSIALALPAMADANGDLRELKELAAEFDGAGRAIQPMTESLARNDVNRGLARGNEVAFGNNRSFFDDSAFRVPTPAMPASQPISNNRWDSKDELAGGSTINVPPQTPAANLGTLWAETGVGRRAAVTASANERQISQAVPSDDGSVFSVNGVEYANNSLAGNFHFTPAALGVPPLPPVASDMSVAQAQSIIEARRFQFENPPASGRPSILSPTAPVSRLSVARDEKALADRQTATRYAEWAQEGEVAGKQTLAEVEKAWSDPVRAQSLLPNVSPDGGVSSFGGGGGRRGGLVGGGQAKGGASYAGVSIPPSGQPGLDGRNITDLSAVEQKMDGLKDTPLAQTPEPMSIRARLANDPSGAPALAVDFETKSKAVEDRFGRADDFIVSPEMLDAVKLQIQSAPSFASGAGVAAAKDNLSASRPSLATTPNASSRNFISRGSGSLAPAPTPAPPVSGPEAKDVTVHEFLEDNSAAPATFNALLMTNAVVNYFADVPATAGDNTFAWKFNGNDSWFGGGNAIQGFNAIRVIRDTPGPVGERVEKQTGLKSDANGRVEIQLPAAADGGLRFSGGLSPEQSVSTKLEARNIAVESLKSEVTKEETAGETAASKAFFRLRSTNVGGSVVFNPNVGTNVAPAKTGKPAAAEEPVLVKKVSASAPTPQPEVLTRDNAFSTFSLNVSDVSFKLAAASLEKGAMPDVATVRSEEFINAFDYRDPMPAAGVPVAFAWERARYPFAHNRDALRFSVKTAAQGRDGGKPLNIVLLLDNSGSMERADRVRIIQEALRALAAQLQPQDKLSVVTFSRTARLWADGVTGAQAAQVANKIAALTPEGGTNLEEALDLAYRTALRHYAATAMNRVVLLTDGAANLGNVEPASLKAKVEGFRKQGVALDCFGIGWEGFNDDLLENLSRNGDGRYGFVNTPEEASTEFAAQLAGALQVAASDVKVQVEFNPKRVTAYRQIGYAKHQLTKQQFRDNTVDAAEISASEAGNALYVIETNPRGEGPIATVRARFRIPQTSDYREHEWVVPFGSAVELEQSSSALRLATSASAFSEWLAGSPFAGEVTTDRLLGLLSGVPEVYGADPRPKKLEWMIRQAKSISGK